MESAEADWIVRVIGSCRIERTLDTDNDAAAAVVKPSVNQRRLLERLAASAPRFVRTDELISAIWGDEAPRTAKAALHNQVSRLRAATSPDAIATRSDAYALLLPTDVQLAERELAAVDAANGRGDAAEAFDAASRSLTWLDELPNDFDPADHEFGRRLTELRSAALTARLSAGIRIGRSGWAIAEGEALVAETPFDEGRWALLIEAFETAGRRGDALGAIDRARVMLREHMGIDPGETIAGIEQRILEIGIEQTKRTGEIIVGRDAEVDDIVAAALEGRSVVIRGHTGAGKSVLLRLIARQLRRGGWTVARASSAANQSTPAAVLTDLLAEIGEQIEPAIGVVQGFVTAIRSASERGPIALVVDDIHLAGPSTRAALTAAMALDGVTVIAATDTTDRVVDSDAARYHDLLPLLRDDVSAIVSARLGPPGSVAVDDWMWRMSGGNPTFVESLLTEAWVERAWESGVLPIGDTPADAAAIASDELWPIDESVSALAAIVRRRLDLTGASTRTTIETAAVCGVECPTDLILELVPAPAALAAASALGILESDEGRTRFRHGAVQRIVYADMSPGRRVEIHHEVGNLLARRGVNPNEAARHLLASIDVDPVGATRAALGAAALATRHGAHRDAAAWCARAEWAAQVSSNDALEIAAAIAHGDALRLAGDATHRDKLLGAATRSIASDNTELLADAAFALLQLGSSSETGKDDDDAIAIALHALEHVTDPDRWAPIAAAASLARSMAPGSEECRRMWLDAEQSARSSGSRRRVLPFAYLALGLPDDLEQRIAYADELARLARDAGDAAARFEALHLICSNAIQCGDGAGLRAAVSEMEATIDAVGDVGRRWALIYGQAAVAHLDDRLDESERLSTLALELFSPVSPSRAMATYGSQLLVIRLAQRRGAELVPIFADLAATQPGVPAWHAALAVTSVEHDPGTARRHAALALDGVPRDFTWLAAHIMGGRAAARLGDGELNERYLERLRPWSGRVCWQGTCAYGPVDTVLASLEHARGATSEASTHLQRARGLAEQLLAPVFLRELDDLDLSADSLAGR
jgi:DNA-binding SARP family transcriptional activator